MGNFKKHKIPGTDDVCMKPGDTGIERNVTIGQTNEFQLYSYCLARNKKS